MFYDLGAVRSSDAEAQIRGHQIQTLIKVHNSKDPCELSVCIIHISAGTVVTLRFAYHQYIVIYVELFVSPSVERFN